MKIRITEVQTIAPVGDELQKYVDQYNAYTTLLENLPLEPGETSAEAVEMERRRDAMGLIPYLHDHALLMPHYFDGPYIRLGQRPVTAEMIQVHLSTLNYAQRLLVSTSSMRTTNRQSAIVEEEKAWFASYGLELKVSTSTPTKETLSYALAPTEEEQKRYHRMMREFEVRNMRFARDEVRSKLASSITFMKEQMERAEKNILEGHWENVNALGIMQGTGVEIDRLLGEQYQLNTALIAMEKMLSSEE